MCSSHSDERSVLILMIAVAIIGCNAFLLSPILNDIASSLSVSVAQIARAIAAYGGATALSSLFLAPYAAMIGVTRSMRYAAMLMVMGIVLSAGATTGGMLILAQALTGIAAGLMLPATYAITAYVAPEGGASAALGKVIAGWSLAMVAGVPLSAAISDMANWRIAYGILAIMGGIFLFFSIKLPEIDASDERSGFSFYAYRSNPEILIVFLITLLYMTSFYGVYSFIGTFTRNNFNDNATLASGVTIFYGVGFGLASIKSGLIDRYSPKSIAWLIFVAISLVYFAISQNSSSLFFLFMTCLIWGGVNNFGLNVIVSMIIQLSPGCKTTSLGIYSALSYGGAMIGSFLYGYIFNQWGFSVTAIVSLILCLISALLAWVNVNYVGKARSHGVKKQKN
ncbi:Sugar efflux transporter B [Serratia rubidaea]|nr:Sugar efflux transporter B [Serratia rubidaea]